MFLVPLSIVESGALVWINRRYFKITIPSPSFGSKVYTNNADESIWIPNWSEKHILETPPIQTRYLFFATYLVAVSTPAQEREPLQAFVLGSSLPSKGQSQYPSFIHFSGMAVSELLFHPVRHVVAVGESPSPSVPAATKTESSENQTPPSKNE